jgi:uracil-DNA glycosylase
MLASDIKDMLTDIDESTKNILVKKLKTEFAKAICAVNARLQRDGLTRDVIVPPPAQIFNGFRLCPWDSIKIVLIGQDPYPKIGDAMGLAFSVAPGVKVPKSLDIIYDCLVHYGLLRKKPTHGDLSSWTVQGMLMFNAALTTCAGKPNYNAGDWAGYTDKLLSELSAHARPLIFILLGGFAQKKEKFIDKTRHTVLKWGHPSLVNNDNKTDNVRNFKYCDVWSRANDVLIAQGCVPINYNSINGDVKVDIIVENTVESTQNMTKKPAENVVKITEITENDPAPLTIDTLWVFTDGASIANGKAHCVASWAYLMTDGGLVARDSGMVEPVDIPGKKFKTSNNRGEITAILRALQFIEEGMKLDALIVQSSKIIIVSDSEYSINCIDKWAPRWIANSAANADKKNMDLLIAARRSLDVIKSKYNVEFRYMRSHRTAPTDTESDEWFCWRGNDLVDRMCNVAIGRTETGKKK